MVESFVAQICWVCTCAWELLCVVPGTPGTNGWVFCGTHMLGLCVRMGATVRELFLNACVHLWLAFFFFSFFKLAKQALRISSAQHSTARTHTLQTHTLNTQVIRPGATSPEFHLSLPSPQHTTAQHVLTHTLLNIPNTQVIRPGTTSPEFHHNFSSPQHTTAQHTRILNHTLLNIPATRRESDLAQQALNATSTSSPPSTSPHSSTAEMRTKGPLSRPLPVKGARVRIGYREAATPLAVQLLNMVCGCVV